MFEIRVGEDGVIWLSGRLDASQVNKAYVVFDKLNQSAAADLSALDYISSAGIAVLLKTYKRLSDSGASLKLTNVSPRVKTVLHYAGLHTIFAID